MNWRFNRPTVRFVTMTPDLAQELLALNDPRRTAASNQSLIAEYTRQKRAGEWQFNGDTFKVNVSGYLIDGQHRLQAVIDSGWTGLTLVVMGVPDSAAMVMDPPGRRSV